MWLRLCVVFPVLLLGAGFYGCSPLSEPPPDEQRNPYYRTAKDRVEARDFAGAIEAFEKALQVNPNSALAHYEVALVFEQHEFDYAAAIYHYNKAIRIRPQGYPAENARERIKVCRQELAKGESMAPIMPGLPEHFERLKEENQRLHRELGLLRAQGSARPLPAPAPANPVVALPPQLRTGPGPAGHGITPLPPRLAGTLRAHTVASGETFTSIARKYQVKLAALTAANPTVDPRRMQPGRVLNIPPP